MNFQVTVSKVSDIFSFIFLNKNVIEKIDDKFSCHNISEQHLINNKMLIKKIIVVNLSNKKASKMNKSHNQCQKNEFGLGLLMLLKC